MSAERLVFGTSTFAAGRLRPAKESRPGIDALAAAIVRGLRSVHSNPNLGTQWAVRQAEDESGFKGYVQHLVKVQVPVGLAALEVERRVEDALTASVVNLGVAAVDAAVIEADLPPTPHPGHLSDLRYVQKTYEHASHHAVATGLARRAMAFCHSPAHLLACLRIEGLAGYAAQYNLIEAWPGLFLDHITAQGRSFLGVAPLGRGRLAGERDPSTQRARALRWVLGHSGVTAAVLTISSREHLDEALAAAEEPLAEAVVRRELDRWKMGDPLTVS